MKCQPKTMPKDCGGMHCWCFTYVGCQLEKRPAVRMANLAPNGLMWQQLHLKSASRAWPTSWLLGDGWNRLFAVLLLNTLQCFGPHFFQKYSINAKSVSTENRLKYISIYILHIFQIKAKILWWIFHFTSFAVSWQSDLCVVNWT